MYEWRVAIILSAVFLIRMSLGLQCGIQILKEENEQLQKVATKCIKNYVSTYVVEKSDNSTNGTKLTMVKKEDTEELEDQTFFAPSRGLKRSRRSPQSPSPPAITSNTTVVLNKGFNSTSALNMTSTTVGVNVNTSGVMMNGGTGVNGTANTNDTTVVAVGKSGKNAPIVIDECTVRCFLQKMEMLNYKGYPDHTKMSEGFRDKFKGNQLQDFVQDVMDECFYFMDKLEGDRLDACAYAAKLAVCLAEKARTNCEDWPVGNLPIPIPIS